jgi:methionyl aminopeptidase
MYTVGNISTNAEKLIKAAHESMQLGIDEIRPGNFFGNIGFAISKYAEKQ